MSIESREINYYESVIQNARAEGDWEEMLSACQALQKNQPDDSKPYSNMGDAFLNLERWEEAVTAYRASLKVQPNFDWAWHNLAVALGRLNQWEEVEKCHQKIKEIKPDFWEINEHILSVKDQHSYYSKYIELRSEGKQFIHPETWLENSPAIDTILKLGVRTCIVILKANSIENDAAHSVSINGQQVESPLALFITRERYTEVLFLLPLTEDDNIMSVEICIVGKSQHETTIVRDTEFTEHIKGFGEYLNSLSADSRTALFSLISEYQTICCDSTLSIPHFRLFEACYGSFSGDAEISLEHSCWLTPNLVYFEASVTDTWLIGSFQVAVTSSNFFRTARGYAFQISDKKIAGTVIFCEDIYTSEFQQYSFLFIEGNQKILLDQPIHKKSYNLEFIQRLNEKAEHQRYIIREKISYAILNHPNKRSQQTCIDLIKKLQRYVLVKSSNPLNPELPFQLFFDQVIPIGFDGVFVAGWLHDPYESLERIEVISDLGFCFNLYREDMQRFERADVITHIEKTKYTSFSTKSGFCAYVRVDDETRAKLNGYASFHSFRFSLKLKSGISFEIVPQTQFYDDFTARSTVLKTINHSQITDSILDECISPAALKLQELCMEKVDIDEVVEFGNLPTVPLVSIIVPIYKRYDFQKVQIALFSNDSFIRNHCEVIYVLDSPSQKFEFNTFIHQHCNLYGFSAKVVFMQRNSGYSSANNAGAFQAQGRHLILMNSDVLPKESGWAKTMLDFYKSSNKVGTVGAKLVYEDDSLQHAGMFFGKTTYSFWQNLHYFKGFPNGYKAAQDARAVPAVTGACLMIARDLYQSVDGLSTEYVIGDFEDSDLCLKCAEKGLENWYVPQAELYHLERQSVPLNTAYSEGLAWHLNARIHSKKWDSAIRKLMGIHSHEPDINT